MKDSPEIAQAGAEVTAIEVTPAMIDAGVAYYLAWFNGGGGCDAVTEREFAEGLYRSMASKKMDHGNQP